MSIFEERDGVTYQNDTSYVRDDTGGLKISGQRRVSAYRVGPRGGKQYVFFGSVSELDQQIAVLTRLRNHASGVQKRISADQLKQNARNSE